MTGRQLGAVLGLFLVLILINIGLALFLIIPVIVIGIPWNICVWGAVYHRLAGNVEETAAVYD